MVMSKVDVLRALHDKQGELTAGANGREQQIVEHPAGLGHLEEAMQLFDPQVQVGADRARQRTTQRTWLRPGEALRVIYDVLREAPLPMAARDIAERVIATKGIGLADDHSRVLIQKTILASLSRAKETSERVTTDGMVRWRVV
jgi:hypothetical protein